MIELMEHSDVFVSIEPSIDQHRRMDLESLEDT